MNDKLQGNCLECGELNEFGLRFDDNILVAVMENCGHEKQISKLKLENVTEDGEMKVKLTTESLI
jgi:hypothetical protein